MESECQRNVAFTFVFVFGIDLGPFYYRVKIRVSEYLDELVYFSLLPLLVLNCTASFSLNKRRSFPTGQYGSSHFLGSVVYRVNFERVVLWFEQHFQLTVIEADLD